METERVREIKQREDAEEAKRKQRVLDRSDTHMIRGGAGECVGRMSLRGEERF